MLPKTKLTWTNIQTKLKHLSQRDLISVVKEVYELDKEVKDFLQAKFYNDTNIIDSYKQKIEKHLRPHPSRWESPRLAKAKKVIQDYKKATNDSLGILELMVYYFALLTEFRFDYGPSIYVDDPAEVAFISIMNLLKVQQDDVLQKYLSQTLSLRRKWDAAERTKRIIMEIAPNLIEASSCK